MAYFVVERSKEDGTLVIPLPGAYETRDAAIAALSAATASGAVGLQGEVFIADLGTAVPVLVMPSAPAASAVPAEPAVAAPEPGPEPEPEPVEVDDRAALQDVVAEAAEPPAEEAEQPGELDEAGADSAFAAWEPLSEMTGAESTLADALKRAATSLEEEGIVAPESIVSGDEGEIEATEADELDVTVTSVDATADETAAWPWANVEAYEIKVDAEEVAVVDDEADTADVGAATSADTPAEPELMADGGQLAEAASEEVVPEEQAIITSAPAEGEETYVPKPVILGDYPDTPATFLAEEPAGPEEAPASVATLEEEPTGPAADLEEDIVADGPFDAVAAVAQSLEPAESPAQEDAVAGDDAPVVPEIGYEATGELKLDEYTCQDCVYSNTCPKVGQTAPADCGSFQWRSE